MKRAIVFLPTLLALPSLALAQPQLPGGFRAMHTAPLDLASEEVELRCDPVDGEPDELTCDLRVRWHLVNTDDAPATAEILFNWPYREEATLRIGTVAIEELPTHRPLNVLVEAQGRASLELTATLRLASVQGDASNPNSASLPIRPTDPLAARHPVLAEPWERVRRGLVWERPIALHFDSVGSTQVRVFAPADWDASGILHETRQDDHRVFAFDSGNASGATPRLGIELSRGSKGDILRNGGPFLALGGTFDSGFRARLGYEIGIDQWVLASVSVDTDFRDLVAITPLLEVASWSLLIAPSFAVGVGAPIRVFRVATVGVRLEASATFFSAAFVASFDYYPQDALWQISLLGRVGI